MWLIKRSKGQLFEPFPFFDLTEIVSYLATQKERTI